MKVYVINHSEFKQNYGKNYIPLMVGAVNRKDIIKPGVLTDDTGTNISEMNDSYCELTGLYWIWKNVKEPIVGLVHYRRFFLGIRQRIPFRDDLFVRNHIDLKDCHLIREIEVNRILKKNAFLVKVSHKYRLNNRKKILQYVSEECLDNLKYVLQQLDVRESIAFQNYLNRHSHVLFNMFIGKKEILDKYCNWLFPLLKKVDEKHLLSSGERYHNREIGYLGEMLFGFWLDYNHIPFYRADTLIPRKSSIKRVAGIDMPDGTNIYPIKDFFVVQYKLISRLVSELLRAR